jgi:hypothetical protein
LATAFRPIELALQRHTFFTFKEQGRSRAKYSKKDMSLDQQGASRTFTGRTISATTNYFSLDASGISIGVGADTGVNNGGTMNLYEGYRAGQKTFGSDNVILGAAANTNAIGPVNSSVVIGLGAGDSLGGDEDVFIGPLCAESSHGVSKSIAIGARAFRNNVSGWYNSVLGTDAFANTGNSSKCVSIGAFSGFNLKSTNNSVLLGYQAGYGKPDITVAGDGLIAIGAQSLFNVSNIQSAIAVSSFSGYNASTASNLFAIGVQAGYPVTSQADIVAIGHSSGMKATLGDDLTLLGNSSGRSSIGGSSAAVGNKALAYALGSKLAAVGIDALGGLDNGRLRTVEGSVALGFQAGFDSLGSNCTYMGSESGSGATGDCCIYIGPGMGKQHARDYEFALRAGVDLPALLTGNLDTSDFPYVAVRGAMQIGQGATAGSNAQQGGLVLNRRDHSWQVYVDEMSGLCVRKDGAPIAYFDTTLDLAPGMDFTATHRTTVAVELSQLINANCMQTRQGIPLSGCVVVSTGEVSSVPKRDGVVKHGREGIGVSCALPIVDLSKKARDKAAFGMFASIEHHETDRIYRTEGINVSVPKAANDERIIVNSGGEWAIWVVGMGGWVENGDLLCTSHVPGLTMSQGDDILRSCTVAKSTMDCKFDRSSTAYTSRVFLFDSKEFTACLVACVYTF